MRIGQGRLIRWRSPLREPYRIASGSFDEVVNLMLELTFDDGTRGWGCAAPAPEVTGETPAAAEAALSAALERAPGRLLEAAPGDLRAIGALIDELLPAEVAAQAPAARCALECALLDGVARSVGLPLARWLGGDLRPLPTSVTIGACGGAETLARAQAFVAAGFRTLKIKGGVDVDEDVARLRLLRERLRTEVALRFDANEGYDPGQALHWIRRTSDLGLECLEQPLPRRLDGELPRLRRALRRSARGRPPLLMVDESIHGLEDARRLTAAAAVDAVNVKLMKCGGVGPARGLLAFAAGHGLATMLSCMDELALGIAPALHLAVATSPTPWLDLDGHLDVVEDPTADAVRLERGELSLPDRAGLGVCPQLP